MAAPRFDEVCSYCCLPLLPVLACTIHATWGPPFSRALYLSCPTSYPVDDLLASFVTFHRQFQRNASSGNSVLHVLHMSAEWDTQRTFTGPGNNTCTLLRECCKQVEAERVSNSSIKLHQTMFKYYFWAQYILNLIILKYQY